MAFTGANLAAQMNNANLHTWAISTALTQAPLMGAYTIYFNGIQTWITAHHGANPFGWNNINGLQTTAGVQVVLIGPQGKAPYNDFFDDTRNNIAQAGFRLWQSATAARRMITVLNNLP